MSARSLLLCLPLFPLPLPYSSSLFSSPPSAENPTKESPFVVSGINETLGVQESERVFRESAEGELYREGALRERERERRGEGDKHQRRLVVLSEFSRGRGIQGFYFCFFRRFGSRVEDYGNKARG